VECTENNNPFCFLFLSFFFFFFFFLVINSFVIPNPVMAFGLRTKSFAFIEGEAEFVSALQWWNRIDDSDQWQRGTYYALCAAYTLVSFIALVSHFLSLILWGNREPSEKGSSFFNYRFLILNHFFLFFWVWSELIYYTTDTPSRHISIRFKL